MKNLFLGSVLSAAIKVASAGLTFLMFMFLARLLDPAEYGRFATMFALGTIAAIAALLGQHTYSIKILSGLDESPAGNPARRRFVRRTYLVVLAGVLAAIGLLLLADSLDAVLGIGVGGPHLLGACLLILPFALAELVSSQYRAFGAISWALIPRDILWRGCVVLFCLAAASLPALFSSALAAMAVISGTLLVLAGLQAGLMPVLFRPLLSGDGDGAGAGEGTRPDATAARALPARQVPGWMWLAALVTMGANLNVVVAALFMTAETVGAYFAAQKISQLLQLPILAINIVAGPAFARLHARGDRAGMRETGRRLALILAVPLSLGAVLIATTAPWLLGLFDPGFAFAAPALIVLSLSFLFAGLGGPVQQVMLMADGERDFVRLTAIGEIAGLALIPLLVPAFGIMGAAGAALAAKVIFTIAAVAWCRSRLGVDTSILALLPGGAAPR